ncbi:MAG TPA: fatty acid desaturase [Chloroflexia bacterium]|nr:fatty acid desaturase [Chloroflexia bacterium]
MIEELEVASPLMQREQQREQWKEDVAPYRRTNLALSWWQIVNTLVPFFLTWYLMYSALSVSYWLTLALAPLAAGCYIRTFIIFHDCTHGSFFKSAWANQLLGLILGVLCLTPFYQWRHSHAIHHAGSGNLDKRITGQVLPMTIKKYMLTNGNILTLTVKEYQQFSAWQRLVYRFYRHPAVLFLIMPVLLFLVIYRFAPAGSGKKERLSVYGTNLAIVLIALPVILMVGLGPFLLVEVPIVIMACSGAVWLFYVQHQYEHSYWESKREWNFVKAALHGSSYYRLPRVLQWFTGNIGFHHIHHLSPRIPNYYLEKCHRASLLFQKTRPLTLWSGLRAIFANLWDEEQQKMVRFSQCKVRD